MSKEFGPSLTGPRLYERTSAKGATYFAGRWGNLKVALLKSKETAEDGSPIWNLVLSQADPYQPKDEAAGSGGTEAKTPANDATPPRQRPTTQRQRDAFAKKHWQAPAEFIASRSGAV